MGERGGASRLATSTARCALVLLAADARPCSEDPIPRAAARRDVQFWVRIYSEVDTNPVSSRERNLAVVTRSCTSHPIPRRAAGEDRRPGQGALMAAALRRLGGQRWATVRRRQRFWTCGAAKVRRPTAGSTDEIRFQLGQSDRFRADHPFRARGNPHPETLANLGLPASSPYSTRGVILQSAAIRSGRRGLWQFMRSPAAATMRIDNAVDDRLDPSVWTSRRADTDDDNS